MALVEIPTNDFINGYSPSLGKRQTIDSRALPNLLAFAKAFHTALGVRLDITEASRSRPRQDTLWEAWTAYLTRGRRPPWAALAARPYTSMHDEVKHGNAADLGSGIATFATAAHQWAVINGPKYGVRPTGLEFSTPEPWHFEIDLTTTTTSSTTTPFEEDDLSAEDVSRIIDAVVRESVRWRLYQNTVTNEVIGVNWANGDVLLGGENPNTLAYWKSIALVAGTEDQHKIPCTKELWDGVLALAAQIRSYGPTCGGAAPDLSPITDAIAGLKIPSAADNGAAARAAIVK